MRALSRRRAEKGDADLEHAGGSVREQATANSDQDVDNTANGSTPRRVFFNTPLSPDLLDEDGTPVQQFSRNKIRTAKYTPLIFIPKNLWLQFHNIANVYFLFVTILAVSFVYTALDDPTNLEQDISHLRCIQS